jgi:hypothetical protein
LGAVGSVRFGAVLGQLVVWLHLLGWSGDVLGAIQINEFMARNGGAIVDPYGRSPDWIEFHNPGATRIDVSGYSVSLAPDVTNRWVFPAGVSIPGRGFLVVWCDPSRPASVQFVVNLNAGEALPGQGGAITLWAPDGRVADSVAYGFQIEDTSLGRVENAWHLLSAPSLGTANGPAAPLDPGSGLKINEWMADPKNGSDWFELYNPGAQPVDLSRYQLTNAMPQVGTPMFIIGGLSYIAAGGWVVFYADRKTNSGSDHVSFTLEKAGGSIRLYSPETQAIDHVVYSSQEEDVSEGRLPDGSDAYVRFDKTDTPGDANYLILTNVWISEILAHTDPPLEDAIEFYNPTGDSVDLSGWYLSNRSGNPTKYRIAPGTRLLPYGFGVLYEYQFKGTNDFTFNSAHGDRAILSAADANGRLTGYRVLADFGPTENAVSIGRFDTSQGTDFVALGSRTLGIDSPRTLVEFRQGRGRPNAYPLVGPVVIGEIMYHPPDAWSTNPASAVNFEFIELQNLTTVPVPFYDPEHPTNTWRIEGEIEFTFPKDLKIPAGGFVLLVDFDPEQEPEELAWFRQRYPELPASTKLAGPYKGRLSNSEGRVTLSKPDPPQHPPRPDAGYVPYIRVDQVKYGDTSPWPAEADGQGASLQRIVPGDYGDDPVNWRGAMPNPGQDNRLAVPDQDHDGMSDDWESQFGFDLQSPEDAAQDTDRDTRSNLEECLSGSHPRDAADYLKFEAIAVDRGVVELSWKARAGKTYTVQVGELGKNFTWERLADFGATGTDGDRVVWDQVTPAPPARVYRLVSPRIP